MKKLLFVFVLGAFAACGNGGSDAATETTTDSTSTMSSGSTMSADTSANTMNADTTSKMGADTGTMNTAH